MKKIILPILLLIAIVSTAAVMLTDRNSRVIQEEGIAIYHYSQPLDDYIVLGTVKSNMTWSNAVAELKGTILKEVKKKYPSAQGIILNDDMDKAEVIIFK